MECEQELVCDLSNGAIFTDLERTLTVIGAKYLTNGYYRRRMGIGTSINDLE